MPPHAVFIVTFVRGNTSAQRAKPYHWVFLIQAYKDARRLHPGIVHQLRGSPGNFHYQGDESAYVLKSLDQAVNKIEVGSVDPSMLFRVAEVLNRVPIVNDKGSCWNCQDWSTRGLEMLRFLEVVGDRRGK